MRKLEITCIVLLVLPSLVHLALPESYPNRIIVIPLLLTLAVLLPIGFAKAIQLYILRRESTLKALFRPLFFLVLFFLKLYGPISAHHAMLSGYLLVDSLVPAYSSVIIEGPVNGKTEEGRKIVAQAIYWEFGAKVPYKTDIGEYVVFEPSDNDVDRFETNLKHANEAKRVKEMSLKIHREGLYLSITQITVFLLVFAATLYYEQKNAYKRRQTDVAGPRN